MTHSCLVLSLSCHWGRSQFISLLLSSLSARTQNLVCIGDFGGPQQVIIVFAHLPHGSFTLSLLSSCFDHAFRFDRFTVKPDHYPLVVVGYLVNDDLSVP